MLNRGEILELMVFHFFCFVPLHGKLVPEGRWAQALVLISHPLASASLEREPACLVYFYAGIADRPESKYR